MEDPAVLRQNQKPDRGNDDVISAVESTPTYKRSKEILASIGSQNLPPEPKRPELPDNAVQGVISFV